MTFLTVAENLNIGVMTSQVVVQLSMAFGYFSYIITKIELWLYFFVFFLKDSFCLWYLVVYALKMVKSINHSYIKWIALWSGQKR